jgi:hypothetical protein
MPALPRFSHQRALYSPTEGSGQRGLLKEAGYDECGVQVTPGCEAMIDEWVRVLKTF